MYLFLSLIDTSLEYFQVFTVSFLTSIILFIPIPYAPVLVVATFSSNLDLNLIAIISAIGVTAGRTLIFILSYQGNRILSNRIKENMLPSKRLLEKYGWIVSFLAAITPFPPDDIVIILRGMVKLSPWKFIITNFAGKLISNLVVVWATVLTGRVLIEQIILQSQSFTNLIILTIISIIIAGITIYSIIKIDWRKIIGKWFPWTLDDQNN
ncbi:MAG TPA: VTT domain-containing protein [Candidatus Saccharimonadales bacterium]|nr:VTT domain-containing protein [Candidatus Saccharimonadales bacterium]